MTLRRMKVGTPAREGTPLALSYADKLRPARPRDPVIGVAGSRLKRGDTAIETSPGVWRSMGMLDSELTRVSTAFLEGRTVCFGEVVRKA